MLSGDGRKGYTVRLSLIFVNALCFSSPLRNPRSAGTATLGFPSSLLHFARSSNGDGDVTSFRSLAIIGNRFGKHNMSSVYYFTGIAHNSKLTFYKSNTIMKQGYCLVSRDRSYISTELLLDRRHEGLGHKHR